MKYGVSVFAVFLAFPAHAQFNPKPATGGSAIFSEYVSIGGCDPGLWSRFDRTTQSPIPECFTTRFMNYPGVAYPPVVGIGGEGDGVVLPGDRKFLQRAQLLVQSKTRLGNNNQEHALGINFVSETGAGPQTNHNQKVALSIFTLGLPGSSNLWGINNDIHVHEGFGNYPWFGREQDHTNFNGRYVPGGCNPCAANQINANAAGDFMTFTGHPITAGSWWAGDNNPGDSNMFYGLFFQQRNKARDTAVGTGLISDATYFDETNARDSLFVSGNHSAALNTSQGNMTYALQAKAGQRVCLNSFTGAGCINYDATNKLLNFNDGKQLFNAETGNIRVSGGYYSIGGNTLSLGTEASGAAIDIINNGGPAFNRLQMEGANIGFGPVIGVTGDDANASLNLRSKGNSYVVSLSPIGFQVAGKTNTINMNPADAGQPVVIQANGPSTEVGLSLRSKGNTPVRIDQNAGTIIGGPAVNIGSFINDGVANIALNGSQNDIELRLLAKGNGPVRVASSGGFQVDGKLKTNPGTPSSSSMACATGEVIFSTDFIYVCTATNKWRRSALVDY